MLNKLFPARDMRIMMWLRWRQFRDGAIYWLRVLGGYQPNEKSFLQNVYVFYLLAIVAFWAFTMWSWAIDTARNIGLASTPDAFEGLLNALPVGVLVVQVLAMVVALRSTPLKLSFADMAYVAGSPIARSVPVLLSFFRQVIVRGLLFGALWAMLSVTLLESLGEGTATMSRVLGVVAVVLLLVIFTWAGAWLLGILRLVYPRVSRVPLLWLAPLLLLGVYYVAPDAVLWPGRAVILIIYHQAPVWLIVWMAALAVILVGAFLWLGQRINMVQAIDESRVHARLSALGLMAWRMPDVQLRIRAQESRAGSKPRWSLPVAYGRGALFTRSTVSYVRHPLLLLVNFGWGAAMTYVIVLILVYQLPVQFWIGWLLVAGLTPPIGLLHTYQMDIQERFLRQFLPLNGFQIFVSDVGMPLLLLIAGAYAVWFWQPLPGEIIVQGLIFIPLMGTLIAMCGAYAMTTTRVLQRRLLAVGLSFGLPLIATTLLHTSTAGLVVLLLAITTLGGLIMQEA